jgi:hypothetical protein
MLAILFWTLYSLTEGLKGETIQGKVQRVGMVQVPLRRQRTVDVKQGKCSKS